MDLTTYSSNTPLHIGDYIVLRLSKPDEGWLTSEGLLDDECFVTPEMEDFHDCIWEIHVQNQYSATREYKEALAQHNQHNKDRSSSSKLVIKNGGSSSKKAISQEYLTQLHRAALNEQRLNEKLMSLKLGKPINFGDPIQLRHVKSRKFLTISSNILANEERENMKITVDSDGDSLSCVGFMPRHRYDREGQVLTNNAEVIVRVHERPREYLHAAKYSDTQSKTEVNCSLESSFWTLILYQRVVDIGLNSIMAGQLVTLQDPDSLACITLDNQLPGITEKANVVMSSQFQTRDLATDTAVGTHLLWLIEKSNVIEGGPLGINADLVTFRDLNTGLFMRIENDGLVAVKKRSQASTFEIHNSPTANTMDCIFLEAESAINLSTTNNLWVGNLIENQTAAKLGAKCIGFSDKSMAVSLSVSASLYHKLGVHLHVGMLATTKLRKLLKVTEQYENGLSLIRELAHVVKDCNSILESLCAFLSLTDTTISTSKEETESLHDGHKKEVIMVRQNMIREQGVIDVILDLLSMTESNIYDKIKESIVKRDIQRSPARRIVGKTPTSIAGRTTQHKEISNLPVVPQTPERKTRFSIFSGNKSNVQPKSQVDIPVRSTINESPVKGSRGTSTTAAGGQPKNLQELIARKKKQQQLQQQQQRLAESDGEDNDNDEDAPNVVKEANENEENEDEEEEEEEDEVEEDKKKVGHNESQLTVSQTIAQKCLKVLLHILMDNAANQLYVADRFPELLAKVKEHRLAVLCVQEMLKENLMILQTKVRQREIDIFVGLLAQSEMSVTFLRLLQSTASCPMGVDATQRMVAYALFAGAPEHGRLRTASADHGGRARTGSEQMSTELDAISPGAPRPEGGRKSRNIMQERSGNPNQRLIIQISADKTKRVAVYWGDLSLYCPVDPRDVVKGYAELMDGLPEISVFWKMKGENDSFNMNQLFGFKDKVPLAVMCASVGPASKPNTGSSTAVIESFATKAFQRKSAMHRKSATVLNTNGKNKQNVTLLTIANHKAQVAEYFKTQLYLVADLCLDRNYVSIGILEPLYEYEVMVAMLKDPVLPASFKAPVCRVLRCLYVDRDPQVASQFPRYIRTSVSLNMDSIDDYEEEVDKPMEDINRLYKFALLQKILSDYVHNELDLFECDELSAESIELLQSLVKFGFYENVPQILDIWKPLLKVLDQHQTSSTEKDANKLKEIEESSSSNVPGNRQYGSFSLKDWFTTSSRKYERILPDGYELEYSPREDHVNVKKRPWYKVWIERTDSLYWMLFVFAVVLVSIAMVILQFFDDIDLKYFYIATTGFFGIEYFFRALVHSYDEKGLFGFCCDPFNILDALLIGLDVVMLVLGVDGGQASVSRASRGVRIIRIVRVARFLRAARLLKEIAQASKSKKVWEIPVRYRNIKRYEAKTVVNILKVLTMFYDRIQDNTLELGIQAFSQWCKAIKNKQNCDPVQTFHKALASEERLSSELSVKFDSVLLDAMMYSEKSITHSALHLLMVHKSQKDLFFKIFENVQIIYSPRIENICKHLTDMLRELKGLAEMFEMWSDLESTSDLKSAHQVLKILSNIKDYLVKRNEDRSLSMRSMTLVDEEVQNLLRNLDAMTTFMLLQESLYCGGREELKPMIRNILKLCNNLICLFVKTSEYNQAVAFKYLSWFVDRADDDIDSTATVRTILEGNESLIKQCSRRYLSDFAQKIVSKGRKPEYLDLFVGMTELSKIMGSHVLVVETEISTFLTGREWKKHILLWCASSGTREYEERKLAMYNVRTSIQSDMIVSDEHLTPELRYHTSILILLASCNLGPKLQAIYPVQDILTGIMDNTTIFPVKKRLAQLLIEVLKSSTNIEKLDMFWQLLDRIALEMETLHSEMFNFNNNLMNNQQLIRIQKGEWLEISSRIISTFFLDFDLQHFIDRYQQEKSSNNTITGNTSGNDSDNNNKYQPDANHTIERLHQAIRNMIDEHATLLGTAITEELIFSATVLHYLIEPEIRDYDAMENNDIKLKASRVQHQRNSLVFADMQQVYFRNQFKVFLQHIKAASSTAREEIIDIFKNIPSVHDPIDANVRFEPLIKKLTTHFRSSIKRSPLSRSIHEGSVETCAWFLKAMRHLIEDALHVTFEQLDDIDIGSIIESSEVERLRVVFNEQGVTYLCLDLIAVGVEHSIYIESIKLLIMMLLKSGGSPQIQKSIYLYLYETDSILFFEHIKDMIESIKTWCNKESESNSITTTSTTNLQLLTSSNNYISPIPEDIIVLHLLQGICEGSYKDNRNQLREQTGNSKLVNLLEALASLVGILSRVDSFIYGHITIKVLKTVLRLVQGPCKGNQEQFVLHTELLISLNRIIRAVRPNMRNVSTVMNNNFELLKESVVDVLRGMIEGQAKTSLSCDRVATTIDFNVLQVLVNGNIAEKEFLETIRGPQAMSAAQAKYLVLTETMRKTNTSSGNTHSDDTVSLDDSHRNDISSVEVQWNNQIHIVHFPVPQLFKDLSTESKDTLITHDQDFASRELKLIDFIIKIKLLYKESKHQQFLKYYGLNDLWTIKYYLTRLMFINAVVMNCLIVSYYGTTYHSKAYYGGTVHPIHHDTATDDHSTTTTTDDHHRYLAASSSSGSATFGIHDHLFAPNHIKYVLTWLNIIQLVFAGIIVGIYCLVQLPITFTSEYEKYHNYVTSFIVTLMDPMPIWYCAYFVFTFLGLEIHHFFLSALLLDWIIIDSTTQDLLLAVRYPARQLIATLVIILIMQNIFAGIMFVLYRHDVITVPIRDMWDALKLCISYGFRGEYGIDHEMEPTLGVRMVLDMTFYFIILSILRHIFFAIIVDTFGTIRELKSERESEAKNTCFICGIERHDYDRVVPIGTTLGFSHHRNIIHNPFNYMAFIMNIWNQSQSEDSSLEIYVRECLKKGDVNWFPSGVHHETTLITVDAHMIDDHGGHTNAQHGGGGHGGGHGSKKKHGHGHGNSHNNSGGGGGGGGGGTHSNPNTARPHSAMKPSTSSTNRGRTLSSTGSRPRSAVNLDRENSITISLPTAIPTTPTATTTIPTTTSDPMMMDKIQSIQQQLVTLTKAISNTTVTSPLPTSYSIVESDDSQLHSMTSGRIRSASTSQLPPLAPSASFANRMTNDSQVVETMNNINNVVLKLMDRVDEMEKKLLKSHKYLRHRVRSNNAMMSSSQLDPNSSIMSTSSPWRNVLIKKKVNNDIATPSQSIDLTASYIQDDSEVEEFTTINQRFPVPSNDVPNGTVTVPPPSNVARTHSSSRMSVGSTSLQALQQKHRQSKHDDGNDADDDGDDDEEDKMPKPASKLENSDGESSMSSGRVTVKSENEGDAAVAPLMPIERQHSVTSKASMSSTPSHMKQTISGPPKSLVSNLFR